MGHRLYLRRREDADRPPINPADRAALRLAPYSCAEIARPHGAGFPAPNCRSPIRIRIACEVGRLISRPVVALILRRIDAAPYSDVVKIAGPKMRIAGKSGASEPLAPTV